METLNKITDNQIVVLTGEQLKGMLHVLTDEIIKAKIEVKPIPLSVAAEHFGVGENTLRVWSKAKTNGFPIHNFNDGKGKSIVFWHEITDAILNHKFQK